MNNIFKISKCFLIFLTLVFGACENSETKEPEKEVPEVTLTFHKHGWSEETVTQTVPGNTTVTLRPNEFTRGGYEFVGWRGRWHIDYEDGTRWTERLSFEDEGKFQNKNMGWDANKKIASIRIRLDAQWASKYEPLSVETEERIKQDYFDVFIKDEFPGATMASANVLIKKHYGSYDNSIVVRMDDKYIKYDDTEKELDLSPPYNFRHLIRYSGFDRVWVWNNGKFYRFDEWHPDLFYANTNSPREYPCQNAYS